MIDQYIRQYGRRLYGLCLHLCANRPDADDLYQETWLKVMKNLDKFDSVRDFEPWLTQICVNEYRNILRRIRRSPFYDNFSSAEEKELLFSSIQAEEKSDYTDLYAAIRRLPEKLRITIVLYYFEDMDIRSTAKVLKIPEGTVKSRLNQAKKKLKGVLADGETADT